VLAEKQQIILGPKRNFVAHSPHLPPEPDLIFRFALTLDLDRFLLASAPRQGPVLPLGRLAGEAQSWPWS
jgi:hypothetical protein